MDSSVTHLRRLIAKLPGDGVEGFGYLLQRIRDVRIEVAAALGK